VPGVWLDFGNAGQDHRAAVGKFSYQRQTSAHGLHGLPQSRKQKVAPFFEFGNAVLADPESLGHPYLSELARAPQVLQRHFLGDELGRARLYLRAASYS